MTARSGLIPIFCSNCACRIGWKDEREDDDCVIKSLLFKAKNWLSLTAGCLRGQTRADKVSILAFILFGYGDD